MDPAHPDAARSAARASASGPRPAACTPAHARDVHGVAPGTAPQPYERHAADLTRAMVALIAPVLPTEEEYRIKEATRRQLERLAARVCSGARLRAFGSMANGFALRNSGTSKRTGAQKPHPLTQDMDLCCLLPHDGAHEPRSPAEMVEILGALIREETDFHVLPLPKARIPIIKISRAATEEVPCDIACDIGFNNSLALENTRLLLSYALIDPPRLRTLVLFIKVWTKRRKLNAPYTGTLSSYGYTLLVLFYLIHVKRPPVLPNLQRIPPGRPLAPEDVELEGRTIYFYDDMAALRKEWHSACTDSVGELLLDFFRYFARDFNYAKEVIALHTEAGLVTKESRGWSSEYLCIEDPFQHGYNVSRTVTKDGLYTIRGEFMRAGRLLANRSARAASLLEELCEEREDTLTRAPDFPSARRHHPEWGPRSLPRHTARERHEGPLPIVRHSALDGMAKSLGALPHAMAYPPPPTMLTPLSPHLGGGPSISTTHDALPHSEPGVHPVQYALPLVPGAPGMPAVAGVPSMPGMPGAPHTPGTQGLPNGPAAHPAPHEHAAKSRAWSDTPLPAPPGLTYHEEEAVQLSPSPPLPPDAANEVQALSLDASPRPTHADSPKGEAEGGVFSMSPVV